MCTSFLPALLPVVAHGVTTKDLFEALGDLPPPLVARIRSLIIDTAGEPPELLINLQFDLTAARAGRKAHSGSVRTSADADTWVSSACAGKLSFQTSRHPRRRAPSQQSLACDRQGQKP